MFKLNSICVSNFSIIMFVVAVFMPILALLLGKTGDGRVLFVILCIISVIVLMSILVFELFLLEIQKFKLFCLFLVILIAAINSISAGMMIRSLM